MSKFNSFDFYLDALFNAPYPAGVLYLARHIRADIALTDIERNLLFSSAFLLYSQLCQRNLFFDL